MIYLIMGLQMTNCHFCGNKIKKGTTDRVSISNVIMQGTVWGSLCCTSTIDQVGKQAYSNPDALCKYNGVPTPPLSMVDSILTVTNVTKAAEINTLVNTFIEHKKLKLSHDKCFRIHIGKGHSNCPELKVHNLQMKESDQEKYLGDMIDKSGTNDATINNRKSKGEGIVAEILSIISEIPLGPHKTEVALKLREAMLINGILFNSEAWHSVTNAQIAKLECVDNALLRGILKAHRE